MENLLEREWLCGCGQLPDGWDMWEVCWWVLGHYGKVVRGKAGPQWPRYPNLSQKLPRRPPWWHDPIHRPLPTPMGIKNSLQAHLRINLGNLRAQILIRRLLLHERKAKIPTEIRWRFPAHWPIPYKKLFVELSGRNVPHWGWPKRRWVCLHTQKS